jgi:putative transposase
MSFSLSYHELEEMMSMRSANVDHFTLQSWVKSFALFIEQKGASTQKKAVNGS